VARLSSRWLHCRCSSERPNTRYGGLSSMRCSPRATVWVGDHLSGLFMRQRCTGGARGIRAPPVLGVFVGWLWSFSDFKVRSYCGSAVFYSLTSGRAGSTCIRRRRWRVVHEKELVDGKIGHSQHETAMLSRSIL
jgi:hypothetical protein